GFHPHRGSRRPLTQRLNLPFSTRKSPDGRAETFAQRKSGITAALARIGANRMNGLRNWSLGFLGTAVAITVSYLWLDQPIAQLAHAEPQRFDLFEKLTLIPDAL